MQLIFQSVAKPWSVIGKRSRLEKISSSMTLVLEDQNCLEMNKKKFLLVFYFLKTWDGFPIHCETVQTFVESHYSISVSKEFASQFLASAGFVLKRTTRKGSSYRLNTQELVELGYSWLKRFHEEILNDRRHFQIASIDCTYTRQQDHKCQTFSLWWVSFSQKKKHLNVLPKLYFEIYILTSFILDLNQKTTVPFLCSRM